ncbi:DUF484 family protein [Algihabitans albus]|uniref:DUF484 family protein n=1 Tax=Algihabitans albus TaxID=2164067 RepID=UPI0013C2EE82|nr:DUF484 family protein [Algihabitans albus]
MANRRDAAPDSPERPERSVTEGLENAPRRTLGAGEVAAYLRRHPDFLKRHPELLDAMVTPVRATGDGVLDFQQAMVERLRREVAQALETRDELVSLSRANALAQQRLHRGLLGLLAARSFEHLIETLTTDLTLALDVDVVSLCVEPSEMALSPPKRPVGVYRLEAGTVEALLGPSKRVRLIGDTPGDAGVFPTAAGLVRSSALVRLNIGPTTPPALIGLGSRDPGHFEEGQGTELLGFLGQAVEHLVRAWLDLPE